MMEKLPLTSYDDDLNANHMRGVSSITMFMRESPFMKTPLLALGP